jgi:peptidoglycan/LPS O-acetylase OafA/YrhL
MKHIKEFDGLRGLLALWVFATHVIELGPYPGLASPIRAYLAVDIFIILSGFVIFHLLNTGEDYRTFITRRWFRLFPVFAVCFLIALILYVGRSAEDETAFGMGSTRKLAPHLVAHALMLHGVVPDEILPHAARAILPPAWSISVEWQFYLLAPLLFAFVVRPNWKLGLVMVVLLGARILHDAAHASAGGRALHFEMAAFLPLRLEFFAVGAGSYALWQWLLERNRPLNVPRLCYALLLPVLILVAKKSPAIAFWLAGLATLVSVHFGSAPSMARHLSRFLNSSLLQFLGKISYPLYLLHLPALVIVRRLMELTLPEWRAPVFQVVFVIAGLAATIGGAWLLHHLVEHPMIQSGKRLTKSWKDQTATAVAVPTASTP